MKKLRAKRSGGSKSRKKNEHVQENETSDFETQLIVRRMTPQKKNGEKKDKELQVESFADEGPIKTGTKRKNTCTNVEKKKKSVIDAAVVNSVQENTIEKDSCRLKKQKTESVKDSSQKPVLKTRVSADNLVNAFKEMSDEQRNAIKDMGFGSLMEFQVTELPTTLSYWLLDNFDPKGCVIKLQSGRGLHVAAEDVTSVLGLPSGKITIQRKAKNIPNAVVDEWRTFFPTEMKNVTAKMLIKSMLEQNAGSLWFKRMFLILMTTCLIECLGNGYVSTQIIGNFEDVAKARELDWGQYIKRCLVEQTQHWQTNKEKFYTGPILFLLGLYVDRVELYERLVTRSFPSLKGWTCTLLRKREKQEIKSGGFGHGYPVERYIHVETEPEKPADKGKQSEMPAENQLPSEIQQDKNGSDPIKFAEDILKEAKIVAGGMSRIISIVQSAPLAMMENIHFKKVVDTTEQLLVCKFPKPPADNVPDAENVPLTQADDDFWGNPDVLAVIEEIEKCMSRRDEYKLQHNDGPSFSLGLTQEFAPADEKVDGGNETNSTAMSKSPGDKVKNSSKKGGTSDKGKGKQFKTNEEADEQQENKEGEVEVTHKMVKRGQTGLKKTPKLMSPFQIREVNPTCSLDKVQKELYYWVMNDNNMDRNTVVFDNMKIELHREEMLSMGVQQYISSSILDVWSTILNSREELRSPDSPCRFFATTNPCVYTVVDHPKDWNFKQRQEKFIEKLTTDVNNVSDCELKNIDLFFFPIYQNAHYYIICFNTPKGRIEIIDNSLPFETEGVKEYGEVPLTLTKMFVKFLDGYGLKKKINPVSLSKIEIERLQMPWRNTKNVWDCGIYVMRHMETYMGIKQWKCGIQKESTNQMKYLRAKYVAAILSSDINVLRDHTLSEASNFCKKTVPGGKLDVNKALGG